MIYKVQKISSCVRQAALSGESRVRLHRSLFPQKYGNPDVTKTVIDIKIIMETKVRTLINSSGKSMSGNEIFAAPSTSRCTRLKSFNMFRSFWQISITSGLLKESSSKAPSYRPSNFARWKIVAIWFWFGNIQSTLYWQQTLTRSIKYK